MWVRMENVSCIKKKGHWKSKWTSEKGSKAHFIKHQTQTHAQALQVKRSRSFCSKCWCMIVCLQLSEGGAAGGTGQEGGSGPSQEAAGLHAESAGAGRRKTNGTESAVSPRRRPRGFWLAAFGCYICFCLHRKSSPWCCCPSAWRRASKTSMQTPLSGDRFDPLQSIHPSIHPFMLLTWQLTTDCSHVKNLMTVVRWLSVLDEKERGSHSLSTTCGRCH